MFALRSAWLLGFRGAGALTALGALGAVAMLAAAPTGAATQAPTVAPGSTPLVRLRLEARGRYEYLIDDFRASSPGDVDAVSFRTLVAADVGTSDLFLALELEDGRAYANQGAPLNATHVDAMEVLQARLVFTRRGVFSEGDAMSVAAGRLTVDLGGRRLIARNAFRNTINGFTGLDASWTSAGGHSWRGLALLPVIRRPRDAAALADNEIQIDREDTDALLTGLFYGSPALGDDVRVEAYVLHYGERDAGDRPSLDRRYLTPGVRVLRPAAVGRTDFQIELIAQVGEARGSLDAADETDLDHLAFSGHASVGHRFRGSWTPRLVAAYDFATGDRDPSDAEDERFDPLFGPRRFELGPTGFYGAFARNNIRSPMARLEVFPAAAVDAAVAYRPFWLDSARDGWVLAGVSDPTGSSGTFLGHQVEGALRARLLPGRLTVEVGGAWLARGDFAKTAPGGRDESPLFTYAQLTLTGDRS